MGLALPHDAFEAVQRVPVDLVLPEPNDAADLDDKLAQIAGRIDADFKEWRPKIKEILKAVPIVIKDHLKKGGNREEIIRDLEIFRHGVENRLEKTIEFMIVVHNNILSYKIVIGKSHRSTIQAERVYQILQKESRLSSQLIDSLTTTIADIDPESRGGPSFDKADDLIAYLDR